MPTFTLDVSGYERYILEVNTSTADQFTNTVAQDNFFLEIEQGTDGTAETRKNVIEITTSAVDTESYSITVEKNNEINLIVNTDFVVSHPTISAASSVNNSGSLFVQDILLDQYGHITGINSSYATGTGIGAASTFLDLVDTPSSYSGYNNYLLSVNAAASAIEFVNKAKRQHRTISTDVTLTNNDDIVLLDSSAQTLQITMPYATGLDGYTLTIKKIAGNNNCIINAQSGEYIDSQAILNIHYINESFSLFSNGNNWCIL